MPSDREENIVLVETIYEAFGEGDVETVLDALHEKVTWIESPGHPLTGTYVGPEAVREGVLTCFDEGWEGCHVHLDQVVADGPTVVASGLLAGTYKATGRSMKARFAQLWRIEEGKVVEVRQVADTMQIAQAITLDAGKA